MRDALNWGGLLLSEAEDLDNNALDDIVPSSDLSGALSTASALMTGVIRIKILRIKRSLVKDWMHLLDVSGSLMVGANPIVGAVDTFLPEGMKIVRNV